MTDQDRGAYTPQTDAPLAFDARYSKGSGERPAPTALILSGVVLIALLAALAFFYRHGFRDSSQPAEVVAAPAAATKAPPSSQVASSDSAAGVQILKAEAVPAGEGHLPGVTTVPPPETVVPRPVAAQPAPSAPADPANLRPAQPQTAATAIAAAKPLTAKPLTAGAAAPVTALPLAATPTVATSAGAPVSGTPKPVKLAKAAVTAKPSKPVDAEIPTGAPVAQIGAFSSAALALKGWSDDAAVLPGQMAGKSRKVEMAEVNGKTYYRSFVGGFATREAAAAFCASLTAAGRNCIVK